MLKIAGSVLVVLACMGYASGLLAQIVRRRDMLKSCLEMTELLSGEIRYERVPMAEALYRIRTRLNGVLSELLAEIADRLEHGECSTMEELWEACFRQSELCHILTGEELREVIDVGKNLGFLDSDVQVGHLAGCRERLNKYLEKVQTELEEKRRLYRSLSLAAGIFVILILL